MASSRTSVGTVAMSSPVLIGGASRSGKTLVRWMLHSHPRIAVSRRTELWPRFHDRYGDLSDPRNLERCLGALRARPQVAALEPDVDRLRRELGNGPATYPRLFALLHEHWAECLGRARWGDQSAGLEHHVDAALAAWPDARVLLLVRDPRDRHAALGDRSSPSPSPARSAASWMRSVGQIRRAVARHPRACMVVRYEDLVRTPKVVVAHICQFLGEDHVPAMERMEAARRYDHLRADAHDGIPVTSDGVGRFRSDLAVRDAAVLRTLTAGGMLALGYSADGPGEHGPDRIGRWPARRARRSAMAELGR